MILTAWPPSSLPAVCYNQWRLIQLCSLCVIQKLVIAIIYHVDSAFVSWKIFVYGKGCLHWSICHDFFLDGFGGLRYEVHLLCWNAHKKLWLLIFQNDCKGTMYLVPIVRSFIIWLAFFLTLWCRVAFLRTFSIVRLVFVFTARMEGIRLAHTL